MDLAALAAQFAAGMTASAERERPQEQDRLQGQQMLATLHAVLASMNPTPPAHGSAVPQPQGAPILPPSHLLQPAQGSAVPQPQGAPILPPSQLLQPAQGSAVPQPQGAPILPPSHFLQPAQGLGVHYCTSA